MNRLEVFEAPSKYIEEPHKVLAVDGSPLDEILDAARPDCNLLGLVPALLDWLSDREERLLVRERILPAIGRSAIAPLLMCPDDLDLSSSALVLRPACCGRGGALAARTAAAQPGCWTDSRRA